MKTITCEKCDGSGVFPEQYGPEDCEMVFCSCAAGIAAEAAHEFDAAPPLANANPFTLEGSAAFDVVGTQMDVIFGSITSAGASPF